jgi:hypothetical protein
LDVARCVTGKPSIVVRERIAYELLLVVAIAACLFGCGALPQALVYDHLVELAQVVQTADALGRISAGHF